MQGDRRCRGNDYEPEIPDPDITNVQAAQLLNPEDAAPDISMPRGIPLDELLELYATVVGRPTKSRSRDYLRQRIMQALQGRIVVGPRTLGRWAKPREVCNVLISVEPFLPVFDAGRRRLGLRSRSTLFRRALHDFLEHAGETEAAAAIKEMLFPFDVPVPRDTRVEVEIPTVSPQPGRPMKDVRITLHLTPAAITHLDAACKRLGLRKRTFITRVALHWYFETQGEAQIAAALEPWLPVWWRRKD